MQATSESNLNLDGVNDRSRLNRTPVEGSTMTVKMVDMAG
jgi:hypothetical protein